MGCFYQTTLAGTTYCTNDGTAAPDSTVSSGYYETSDTARSDRKVEELLQAIKKKIVYPWMVLPPSKKFEKPLVIFKSPAYDRKLLINAYKTSARK